MNITVPSAVVAGASYARFRFEGPSADVLTPDGAVYREGEVEDYQVEILGRDFGDAPDPTGAQAAGDADLVVGRIAGAGIAGVVGATHPVGAAVRHDLDLRRRP